MGGTAPADDYDRLIFGARMRDYFGPSGYFNVGYWANGAANPELAAQALTDRLIATLPEKLDAVADIGCGLGATTLRLTQFHPHAKVFAVNFSGSQLKEVQVRCPAARLVHADAVRTGLPSASLSAILSIEAAFHFDTRIDFFHEAFRLLRSGGVLAMTDILLAKGRSANWTVVPAANFLANADAYRQALASAGFVNIQIEDALDACWEGFCREQERRLRVAVSASGNADRDRADVARLRAAVTHYLLVSAQKPYDTRPVVS
jgi:MPBQ/MSBQ methyltransferase